MADFGDAWNNVVEVTPFQKKTPSERSSTFGGAGRPGC